MTSDSTNTSREHSGHAKRDWRLERCTRLYGAQAMGVLAGSHATVVGLGGVGSYAAEGLARSGVGRLTLVDFDKVCVTNINRQLNALTSTVGQSKADLMAKRVGEINPKIEIRTCNEFYNKHTSASLLEPKPDIVIDCIDNITAKMHLVATCCEYRIPIVCALGASAKLDPTRIRVVPLTETHTDPLSRAVRKFVRRRHGVDNGELEKVAAVFSDEPVMLPVPDKDGIVCGVNCVCPTSDNEHHTCKKRHIIYGTSVCVTATFGMVAASAAIRMLLGMNPFSPESSPGGKKRSRQNVKSVRGL